MMFCMPCYEALHREKMIVNLSSVRKLSVNGIESVLFVKPGVVIAPDMNQLWLDLLDWPRGLHLDLRLWEKHLC